MAQDREEPCIYYICFGSCKKGRKADHFHYCQHCDKYKPRAKRKHINKKKAKELKWSAKEMRKEKEEYR